MQEAPAAEAVVPAPVAVEALREVLAADPVAVQVAVPAGEVQLQKALVAEVQADLRKSRKKSILRAENLGRLATILPLKIPLQAMRSF